MWLRWQAMASMLAGLCVAQGVPQNAPSAVPSAGASDIEQNAAPQESLRAPEAPVSGLVRVDKQTIAVTLGESTSAKKLLLYDFEFDGAAVSTDKLHFKELSPGVLEVTSVAYTVGEWRVRLRDDANYYGLGEHSDTLNHAHTIVRSIMQDVAGAKGSSTEQPVPFFMSTTGYGLWFDTTGQATFDMNASSDTDIIVDADAEKLRLVVLLGPEFPKILDRFAATAGRAMLPPYWAFAPWVSESRMDGGEADKARALGLPASVIAVHALSEVVVNHLHNEGYKIMVPQLSWMIAPGKDATAAQTSRYEEASAQGFFVKNADGSKYSDAVGRSFVDFTGSHARSWWQDAAREALHAGADGFDEKDVAAVFPADAKFTDGSDARSMRNRYAVLEARTIGTVIEKDLKGNGVLRMRSATTGANGLGLVESVLEASLSIENGLPAAVNAGINAGLSGLPLWMVGYSPKNATAAAENVTATDAKAFMRWCEFAAFSPFMMTSDPWDHGDEGLAVYRKYAALHMALFPYRYSAAQEAVKTGMPIMRALVLAYQDDQRARLAMNEYLFGPDLLVAPMVDEGMQRVVYLPRGDWVDYWTGSRMSGAQTIVADAAMDKLPLYVKLGAVLPKLPDDVMTLVPAGESGNTKIQAMDDRRIYELIGPAASNDVAMTDFEGRKIVRSGNTLTIVGEAAAHVIVRWRLQKVQGATVNGAAVKIESDVNGEFVDFNFAKQSTVTWH